MDRYTKKAQVLFSEQQYRKLLEIAKKRQKSVAALLREAAEMLYLKDERSRRKTEAVQNLFSLEETEAPEEYQLWEQQYLNEKCLHAED